MKYDGTNLKEVLEAHERWLEQPDRLFTPGKADFSDADLSGKDLSGANLSGANIRNVRLWKANLSGTNLSMAYSFMADFTQANLKNADLSGAYLHNARFHDAYLCDADLDDADCRNAHFDSAMLTGASLRRADLRGAAFTIANLLEADIKDAALAGADFRGAFNVPYIPFACPETGEFIAWKKCIDYNGCRNNPWRWRQIIVKLLIPADAKRSSATGRKCRADKAKVLAFETLFGDPVDATEVQSMHDLRFSYRIGETVTPLTPFYEDRFEECASGIHFFMNRQEAVDY